MKTSTLSRRSTYSGSLSTYPSGSSTLPRPSRARAGTLARGRISSGKRRNVLLIDGISPGGCVENDKRLAVGDRLLFLNSWKLSRSSVAEAARVFKTTPPGYTMIGVAKMKLVNYPLPRATFSSPHMIMNDDPSEMNEDSSASHAFSTSMQVRIFLLLMNLLTFSPS